MKLSKIGWMVLAVGILIITFGSLGATHSQRTSEGKRLTEELAVAQNRLSKLDLTELYDKQTKLKTQADQATAQVRAAQFALSQPNDSITVTDAFFGVAEAANVEILQITEGALSKVKVDNVECLALSLEATVKGEFADLIKFVTRLNASFPTGQVINVSTAVPPPSDNVTVDDRPSMRVQMVVNSYRGG